MNVVTAPWLGTERLWVVFWVYNWLLGIIARLLVTPLLQSESSAVLATGVLLSLAWVVWIAVSLWRCAFNVQWRGWGYIVRGLVLLIPLLVVGAESGWLRSRAVV